MEKMIKPNPQPCIKARLYVQNLKLRRPGGWEVARFCAIASIYVPGFKNSPTTANEAPFTFKVERNLASDTWTRGYNHLFFNQHCTTYHIMHPLLNGCSEKNGITEDHTHFARKNNATAGMVSSKWSRMHITFTTQTLKYLGQWCENETLLFKFTVSPVMVLFLNLQIIF